MSRRVRRTTRLIIRDSCPATVTPGEFDRHFSEAVRAAAYSTEPPIMVMDEAEPLDELPRQFFFSDPVWCGIVATAIEWPRKRQAEATLSTPATDAGRTSRRERPVTGRAPRGASEWRRVGGLPCAVGFERSG